MKITIKLKSCKNIGKQLEPKSKSWCCLYLPKNYLDVQFTSYVNYSNFSVDREVY